MQAARQSNPGGAGPRLNTEELVTLLGHQRTLFRRLSMLAERQRALVVEDDARPLMALLAERQKLVDGLTGLSARLAPYRERWSEVYAALDDTSRRAVAVMLEEANAALGRIVQADGKDCETLSARRESISQRLSERTAAGSAHGAYATAATPAGVGRLADAEA